MKLETLKGQVICFTGQLSKPRKMFVEYVEALGATHSKNLTKSVTLLVVGGNRDVSAKELKAVDLDTREITEDVLYAMAGITLKEYRDQRREMYISQKIAYESSYAGKWDRLKAAAIASIGKLGNAMLLPSETTRIYIHYTLKERKHAALVKCISANGVAFTDRNGKSCFYGWEQLEALRLMEVADYLAKLKDGDKASFRSRLRALNREEEQRIKTAERIPA